MTLATINRTTLTSDAVFEGVGLHGGEPATAIVHPGENGIRFLSEGNWIKARPRQVTDTSRCTKLGAISTIEHLMSALAGLEITDCDIEVTGGELPGLDGSAVLFYQGLKSSGVEKHGEKEIRLPFKRVFYQEEGVEVAIAKGTGAYRFLYDVGARWPGSQLIEVETVNEAYEAEIAPARTFALEEELPMIEQLGLGKGLDENSAVVLGTEDYLNPVRFPDEPARHKLLDLIGDLYLTGIPPRFLDVYAQRSGHRVNVAAAERLMAYLNEGDE